MTNPDAQFISCLGGYDLIPHIVRLLARGELVALDEIAASAGRTVREVQQVLDSQPGTEWDDDGRLCGFALSLRPTEHRFVVAGRTLYTWCATDTLFFTVILGVTTRVESRCPATNAAVRIDLLPDAVGSVDPADTVVSQRHRKELLADVRSQVCDHGHFFASPAAARGWLAEHPDGALLSIADALERWRAACQELGWLMPEPDDAVRAPK